jgi:hypothetical protein
VVQLALHSCICLTSLLRCLSCFDQLTNVHNSYRLLQATVVGVMAAHSHVTSYTAHRIPR